MARGSISRLRRQWQPGWCHAIFLDEGLPLLRRGSASQSTWWPQSDSASAVSALTCLACCHCFYAALCTAQSVRGRGAGLQVGRLPISRLRRRTCRRRHHAPWPGADDHSTGEHPSGTIAVNQIVTLKPADKRHRCIDAETRAGA
jgi:hypothetical protein